MLVYVAERQKEKYMEQLWYCRRGYGGQTWTPYGDSCDAVAGDMGEGADMNTNGDSWDTVAGDMKGRHGHHYWTVRMLSHTFSGTFPIISFFFDNYALE